MSCATSSSSGSATVAYVTVAPDGAERRVDGVREGVHARRLPRADDHESTPAVRGQIARDGPQPLGGMPSAFPPAWTTALCRSVPDVEAVLGQLAGEDAEVPLDVAGRRGAGGGPPCCPWSCAPARPRRGGSSRRPRGAAGGCSRTPWSPAPSPTRSAGSRCRARGRRAPGRRGEPASSACRKRAARPRARCCRPPPTTCARAPWGTAARAPHACAGPSARWSAASAAAASRPGPCRTSRASPPAHARSRPTSPARRPSAASSTARDRTGRGCLPGPRGPPRRSSTDAPRCPRSSWAAPRGTPRRDPARRPGAGCTVA